MFDTQVKAALADLAGRVPASENPWTEHERRMAAHTRSRRRRFTIGAAAACVLLVAGIAVPILINRVDRPAPPDVASATVGPVPVLEYGSNDARQELWFTVTRTEDGQGAVADSVCRRITPVAARPQELPCWRIRVADDGPARIHPMATGTCLGGRYAIPSPCTGLMPEVLVIATAPDVARLDTEAAAGRTVRARELGRTDRVALFLVDVTRMKVPGFNRVGEFTHTARAADGRLIDRVTLSGQDVATWPQLDRTLDPTVGPVRVVEYIDGSAQIESVFVDRTRDSSETVRDRVCWSRKVSDSNGREMHRREEPCSSTVVREDRPAMIHPIVRGICASGRFGVMLDCPVVTGVVVVATSPEVQRLDVEAVGGKSVSARLLGRSDNVALFVADFMQSPVPQWFYRQRFTYTARDADGRVIGEVTLSAADVGGK